jgi:phenylpyruvate tautomerase PptA (4-oxalocrotonate tautomerase family)
MPIYTCTTVESALTADVKAALAGEISRIHSAINHVPSTYVNVVFPGLPSDSVYTDGVPASPYSSVAGCARATRKPTPRAWPPRSRPRPPGSRVYRPTVSWSYSKAAQRTSPSRAVGCCPSPAKSKLGSKRSEEGPRHSWVEASSRLRSGS